MTMPSITEPTTDPTAPVVPPADAVVAPADHEPEAPVHAGPTAAEIAAELYKLQAADAAAKAPQPHVPDNPPSPTNLFQKGNLVVHRWIDHHDGPSERTGIVVDTLEDEGAGARSVVAWLGPKSGPIGDHELTAV
jgi:hypothetical protein